MRQNNIELKIVVKDRPITEYLHIGQYFVEGRAGSEYEVEVTNHNHFRCEAIISVDGVSITDGKEAGPASAGYLLNARETIRIPGWKLNNEQVAKFAFSGKGESYANQSTGSARNTGVIGIMVFKEKCREVYTSGGFGGFGRGINQQWSDMGYTGTPHMMGMPTSRSVRGIECSASTTNHVEQSLGTGFGQSADFSTTQVQFDRGDMLTMMVLYYDDSKGLRQRGIVMTKPSRQHLVHQPQAFPAAGGCTPPPGWKG